MSRLSLHKAGLGTQPYDSKYYYLTLEADNSGNCFIALYGQWLSFVLGMRSEIKRRDLQAADTSGVHNLIFYFVGCNASNPCNMGVLILPVAAVSGGSLSVVLGHQIHKATRGRRLHNGNICSRDREPHTEIGTCPVLLQYQIQ